MRSNSWPGARPAWSSAIALSLALAACSSSGGTAAGHSPRPSHSRTAVPSPAQPATGPAGSAAVKSLWVTFFNGTVPIARRLPLLQNGQEFASFVSAQAKTTLGALVLEASATVSSVTLQPPDRAAVTYTVLLGGKPLAKGLKGTAVYMGGSWKVATSTFCSLLHLAYASKSNLIPAACGS